MNFPTQIGEDLAYGFIPFDVKEQLLSPLFSERVEASKKLLNITEQSKMRYIDFGNFLIFAKRFMSDENFEVVCNIQNAIQILLQKFGSQSLYYTEQFKNLVFPTLSDIRRSIRIITVNTMITFSTETQSFSLLQTTFDIFESQPNLCKAELLTFVNTLIEKKSLPEFYFRPISMLLEQALKVQNGQVRSSAILLLQRFIKLDPSIKQQLPATCQEFVFDEAVLNDGIATPRLPMSPRFSIPNLQKKSLLLKQFPMTPRIEKMQMSFDLSPFPKPRISKTATEFFSKVNQNILDPKPRSPLHFENIPLPPMIDEDSSNSDENEKEEFVSLEKPENFSPPKKVHFDFDLFKKPKEPVHIEPVFVKSHEPPFNGNENISDENIDFPPIFDKPQIYEETPIIPNIGITSIPETSPRVKRLLPQAPKKVLEQPQQQTKNSVQKPFIVDMNDSLPQEENKESESQDKTKNLPSPPSQQRLQKMRRALKPPQIIIDKPLVGNETLEIIEQQKSQSPVPENLRVMGKKVEPKLPRQQKLLKSPRPVQSTKSSGTAKRKKELSVEEIINELRSTEWEKQNLAASEISQIAKSNPNFINANLRVFVFELFPLATSIRSALAKTALECICDLSKYFGSDFTPFFEAAINELLIVLLSSKVFITKLANECIMNILTGVNRKRALEFLYQDHRKRPSQCRVALSGAFLAICEDEEDIESLIKPIAWAITDANPDTRKNAKEIIAKVNAKFPAFKSAISSSSFIDNGERKAILNCLN